MIQLIRLHIGLGKYLITELPKKKTSKEIINFLKPLLAIYLKELFKIYKSLFLILDPEYCKQKKEFNRQNQLKKDLQRALKILKYAQVRMKQMGYPNWKIKQTWRDFFKNGIVNGEVFNEIEKEIK